MSLTNKYVVRVTNNLGTHRWAGFENGARILLDDLNLLDSRLVTSSNRIDMDYMHERIKNYIYFSQDQIRKIETCVVGVYAYPV